MRTRLVSFLQRTGEVLKKFNWTKISLALIFVFSLQYANKHFWQNERELGQVASGDGIGYYAYLPATFIYGQDFSFRFLDTIGGKYRWQSGGGHCGFCNLSDGKTVNKYFCGQAVANSPFFLIADTITRAGDEPRDGYSYWYMVFVSIGAICYALLGLYCISVLLKRYGINDLVIAIVITGIYFGTNLFFYTARSSGMTHVYSFAFVSVFILQVHLLAERFKAINLFLLAFSLGMIIIIRPVNSMIVFSIPFITGSWPSLKQFFVTVFRRPLFLIGAAVIFTGIVFIQLYLYKIQTGHWYVYAYGKEGFDFMHPHFFEVLFSYNAGMFVYSLVLFLMLPAIGFLIWKKRFQGISFLLFFILITWVISSWWAWNYAGTYGMRPMVEYFSLYALVIALFLNQLNAKRLAAVSVFLILPLIIVVQIQIYQFCVGIIGWDGMTRDQYWRVFLKTDYQFRFISTTPGPQPVPENAHEIFHLKIDFEKQLDSMDWRSVKNTLSVSGKKAVYFGEEDYHPPIWKHSLDKYIPDSILAKGNLMFEVRAKCRIENNRTNAKLIFNFQNQDGIYFYDESYLIHQIEKEDIWTDFHWTFIPPKELKGSDKYEVYITKGDGETMYYDDLELIVWQW